MEVIPLTLGVYETQQETDSRKQGGWPSTWHKFYADQQWSPQEAQSTQGQRSSIQTPIDSFDSSTLLQTSVPRRSRQGFLNYAGTWAMNKGCWDWHRAMGALITLCHTASHRQQGDKPNSPMDLFHLGHFLSFPSWVSPATAALKIMKGLYRIIPEGASSFRKRRAMEGKGGNGEK